MKEKKDPTTLEAFFFFFSLSLLFFTVSSTVTHAFPLPIKEEAGYPMKRGQDQNTRAQNEYMAE